MFNASVFIVSMRSVTKSPLDLPVNLPVSQDIQSYLSLQVYVATCWTSLASHAFPVQLIVQSRTISNYTLRYVRPLNGNPREQSRLLILLVLLK